jgi:mannosyltransferase OCH1-like enzyme
MSDTSPRNPYRDRLKQALALIADRHFVEARDMLDRLKADEGAMSGRVLGEATVLGLPRKLHSAYLKLAKASADRIARVGLQHTLVPDPAILGPMTTAGPDLRRRMNAKGGEPVPRTIHQIWIGTMDVPPGCARWQAHAGATGFAYRLWREADLDALGVTHHPAYRRMIAEGDYPGAVDVARYVILLEEGGIYIDCDWYPARDDLGFADLLPLVGLTALEEAVPRDTGKGSLLFTNSLIAAPPGHPAFAMLLDLLPAAVEAMPDAPAWWSTGPLAMTLVFRNTSVFVPPAGLVAADLPRRAAIEAVEAASRAARENGDGLLVNWKSW